MGKYLEEIYKKYGNRKFCIKKEKSRSYLYNIVSQDVDYKQ